MVEFSESKDVHEVVGWYYLSDDSLTDKMKRTQREGGQVLITESGKTQGAAVLSALASSPASITTPPVDDRQQIKTSDQNFDHSGLW